MSAAAWWKQACESKRETGQRRGPTPRLLHVRGDLTRAELLTEARLDAVGSGNCHVLSRTASLYYFPAVLTATDLPNPHAF